MNSGWIAATALACAGLMASGVNAAGLDEITQAFSRSEFRFSNADSNVPFQSVAWVAAESYSSNRFALPNGKPSDIEFSQSVLSEATFLPILLGPRDALVIGQWFSQTRFRIDTPVGTYKIDDLNVSSFSLPIGWVRQSSDNWQLAAFIAPVGHSARDDGWYFEYLGGAFARYKKNETTAWILGVYADITPSDDFYIPYIGATWALDSHWTLSAVLPWPSVTYAPTADYFFRFGAAPSTASWSAEPGVRHPRIEFSAWNFGFSAERRLWKSVWAHGEVGLSGLRGFTVTGAGANSPNTDLGTTPYLRVSINFHPGEPAAH